MCSKKFKSVDEITDHCWWDHYTILNEFTMKKKSEDETAEEDERNEEESESSDDDDDDDYSED